LKLQASGSLFLWQSCKVHLVRGPLVEGFVGTDTVIPLKPGRKLARKFDPGVKTHEIDLLVLEAAPQTFDDNIIKTTVFVVHADPDLAILQDRGKGFTDKLTPLVGVEYLGSAVFAESLLSP
jgi:hypothetical protein